MANAIDAGIRFTPPYGKSVSRGQMRHAHAALRARFEASAAGPVTGSSIQIARALSRMARI
jgi:hypothetical protein